MLQSRTCEIVIGISVVDVSPTSDGLRGLSGSSRWTEVKNEDSFIMASPAKRQCTWQMREVTMSVPARLIILCKMSKLPGVWLFRNRQLSFTNNSNRSVACHHEMEVANNYGQLKPGDAPCCKTNCAAVVKSIWSTAS